MLHLDIMNKVYIDLPVVINVEVKSEWLKSDLADCAKL